MCCSSVRKPCIRTLFVICKEVTTRGICVVMILVHNTQQEVKVEGGRPLVASSLASAAFVFLFFVKSLSHYIFNVIFHSFISLLVLVVSLGGRNEPPDRASPPSNNASKRSPKIKWMDHHRV